MTIFIEDPDQEQLRAWDNDLLKFKDNNIYQSGGYIFSKRSSNRIVLYAKLLDNKNPLCMASGIIYHLRFLKMGCLVIRGGPIFDSYKHYEQSLKNLRNFLREIERYIRKKFNLWYININITEAHSPLLEIAIREAGFSRPSFERSPNLSNIVKIKSSCEEHEKMFMQKWRNQLRRAQAVKPETLWGSSDDLCRRYILLHNKMCLLKKMPNLQIKEVNFLKFKNSMGNKIKICLCVLDSIDLCGCVIGIAAHKSYYLYAASNEEARKNYLSNLMIFNLLNKLWQENVSELDLVGIDPQGNWGTYNFKKGIGGQMISTTGEWDLASNAFVKLIFNFVLSRQTKKLYNKSN